MFEYTDRSGRSEAAEIRARIERWYAEYPDKNAKLYKELRSDKRFVASYWELLMFTQLNRRGRVQHEPRVPNSDARPDFLFCGDRSFYLEATESGDSDLAEGEAKRMDQVLAAINQMSIADYKLDVVVSPGPGSLADRRVRAAAAGWLDTLDYDTVVGNGGVSEPRYWEHSGWVLRFIAFARREREPRTHALISYGGPFGGGVSDKVRRDVEKKSIKYGQLERPLIVAVNLTVSPSSLDRAVEGLVGDIGSQPNENAPSSIVWSDSPTGAWYCAGQPRRTCSAVLVGVNVEPWRPLADCTVELVHNPWARHPLAEEVWAGPQWRADAAARRFTRIGGDNVAVLLGEG